MNEINKTRTRQSNPKRNKELEISHLENYSEEQEEQQIEEDHNQTSEASSPSCEIQNYNSSRDTDQASERDALANLWIKMFNSAAESLYILASNFKKKNNFPNKLSLFLKVNPNKKVLMLTNSFRDKLRK